eukprot:TRINITY_DN11547_c0_g1_i2.p1 TRINITY_DN11547_c0_g1~~TRINITY_DN11547_c0_g1_i2.p1  ORF type:complete len:165 (-),score=44.89 TRINITY_DN11547_c0_g1_i2:213-707(-)
MHSRHIKKAIVSAFGHDMLNQFLSKLWENHHKLEREIRRRLENNATINTKTKTNTPPTTNRQYTKPNTTSNKTNDINTTDMVSTKEINIKVNPNSIANDNDDKKKTDIPGSDPVPFTKTMNPGKKRWVQSETDMWSHLSCVTDQIQGLLEGVMRVLPPGRKIFC